MILSMEQVFSFSTSFSFLIFSLFQFSSLGDQRDLNPQPFISQTNALPLSYDRLCLLSFTSFYLTSTTLALFLFSLFLVLPILLVLSNPLTLAPFYLLPLFAISIYLVSHSLHTHYRLFFVLSFFDFAFSFSFLFLTRLP